jgi:cytidylate kinase
MDPHVIPHEKYVVQVSRLIQVLSRAGSAVFVGRGAQFVLPRSQTFAVRIVAPEMYRAKRVQQRRNISLPEALDSIRRTDGGRRKFIQRFFRQDISDPHLYDLVINAARLGAAGAADQITYAVRHAAGQVGVEQSASTS